MKKDDLELKTFGCRLNIWESELIKKHAVKSGIQNTVIINSCAVTSEAEKQASKFVRKIRKNNPEKKIIITGCSAQINSKYWEELNEVDYIIGNNIKLNLNTWNNLKKGYLSKLNLENINNVRHIHDDKIKKFKSHSRSFLQIQQGCDHRCTFCIIPYARGPNRSLSIEKIINSVKALVSNGTKEIVLTGVDITSWGSDIFGKPSLGKLVCSILKEVKSLPRLRLSSIDPAINDSLLLDAFETEPRLMPHLHLSIQHGNDIILKRMRRRHLRKDIYNLCEEIKKRRSNISFGADIISGFPTETQEAHNDTKALLMDLNINFLHVFPFSIREGTPSARMPQVKKEIIKARAKEIRLLGIKNRERYFEKRIGTTDMILVEKNNKGHLCGFEKALIMSQIKYKPGLLLPIKILSKNFDTLEVMPL